MITAEELRALLDYNESTGVFTRKYSSAQFKCGGVAGSLHKSSGYVNIKVQRKRYRAHRLAWLYVFGEMPKYDIDHIDGDRSNNRISNLRDVDRSTNTHNRHGPNKTNTSGIIGAYFDKRGFWYSSICVNGSVRRLGVFNSAEDAGKAYVDAKERLGLLFHPKISGASPLHDQVGD